MVNAVSEFLLLGTRRPVGEIQPGQISPRQTARDLIALQAWHRCLRGWGLLRSFALPHQDASELRACLIVSASGYPAAQRLAAGWAQVSGYRVSVLRLRGVPRGAGVAWPGQSP